MLLLLLLHKLRVVTMDLICENDVVIINGDCFVWTLAMRLQNGQAMFSQPHCMVELLGGVYENYVVLVAAFIIC